MKPTKKHFNKFLTRCRAVWIENQNEPICEYLKSVVDELKDRSDFRPNEQSEMGMAYGFKKKLIASLPGSTAKYYKILMTDSGMKEIERLKQSTDAFTGRRVLIQTNTEGAV